MIFNKNEIESSIQYEEDLNLYSVKLAWIQRKFDAVFYSFENIQKSYCKNINSKLIEDWFKIDNTIIGITKVFNYYIVCFISLDTLESNYYFVENFEIFNFKLSWKNYYSFVYKGISWNIWYKTNFKNNNQFEASIVSEEFSVKNNIFNTEIFNKNISHILENKIQEDNLVGNNWVTNVDKNNLVDIADFYVYNDLFLNNNNENHEDFYHFINKIKNLINRNKESKYVIDVTKYDEKYFPLFKINIQVERGMLADFKNNSFKELNNIIKIIFSYFKESTIWYFIDDKNITDFFANHILDITNTDIKKIDTNFYIPEDIFSTDEKYHNIRKTLLKLMYNYFLLKQNLLYIDELKNDNTGNHNTEVAKIRVNIDKKLLNNTIWIYEKNLDKFLEKLSKSL